MRLVRRFLDDAGGATSIEYALIATLVSIVILTALTQIGTSLNTKFFSPVGNGLN